MIQEVDFLIIIIYFFWVSHQPNPIHFPHLAYCIANTVSTRKVAEIKWLGRRVALWSYAGLIMVSGKLWLRKLSNVLANFSAII